MFFIKQRKNQTHISITRGDYQTVKITAKDINDNIIPVDGVNASINIQVREPPGNGTPVLFDGDISYLDDGSALWTIHPDDTRGAEKELYVYDVQIQIPDDIVFTFIPLSDFILLKESTEKEV